MTINNLDEFVNNLWDWSILDGCFGNTRIHPTDVDGLVERNGKFLLIEAKSPGVEIKTGQMIMFNKLVHTGYFTVILVWGEINNPEKITLMTSKTIEVYENISLDKLREITSKWFIWANQTPTPKFD